MPVMDGRLSLHLQGKWNKYFSPTAYRKKKIVAAIMMLDYFDIVAAVLQGDTLAPYLFIICLDYVPSKSIDKMKENGFKLTKERSRRYPAQTITNTDYVDGMALLANVPTQAETLLKSLKRAGGDIGLHVNTDKTQYICFN